MGMGLNCVSLIIYEIVRGGKAGYWFRAFERGMFRLVAFCHGVNIRIGEVSLDGQL
jgi:hypothetical protein